jgi:hypothetical protein
MSVFYSVNATCKIKKSAHESEEVQEILEKLCKMAEDRTCDYKDGELCLGFNGFMSASWVTAIDELLRKLGGHLTDAAVVEYEYEGENGEFIIGPSPEAIARKERRLSLEDINRTLLKLTELGVEEHKLLPMRHALDELEEALR